MQLGERQDICDGMRVEPYSANVIVLSLMEGELASTIGVDNQTLATRWYSSDVVHHIWILRYVRYFDYPVISNFYRPHHREWVELQGMLH
jgi:hypothetical protein